MTDDVPWFRRWFGFAFLPTSWKGWAATGAFLLVEMLVMFLSNRVEDGSALWWLLAVVGFGIFLAFLGLALSKMRPT